MKRPKGEPQGRGESQFRRIAELGAQSAPEGRAPGKGRVNILTLPVAASPDMTKTLEKRKKKGKKSYKQNLP